MVVSYARNEQQSVIQLMFLLGLVLKPRRKRFMSKQHSHHQCTASVTALNSVLYPTLDSSLQSVLCWAGLKLLTPLGLLDYVFLISGPTEKHINIEKYLEELWTRCPFPIILLFSCLQVKLSPLAVLSRMVRTRCLYFVAALVHSEAKWRLWFFESHSGGFSLYFSSVPPLAIHAALLALYQFDSCLVCSLCQVIVLQYWKLVKTVFITY